MKLLVITQVMDRADSALGFFVRWAEELAERVEQVEVICLKKGSYHPFEGLPEGVNLRRTEIALDRVHVHTLGKEEEAEHGSKFTRRFRYIMRFFGILSRLRGRYDAVLVHMNEEYVLLAALYWKLRGVPVYLWRNHYDGSWRTRLAVVLSTKVFCTSQYSYTAQFKKAVIMPVGVDVESLNMDVAVERMPNSILFLARFDRSKRPHLLVEALAELHKKGIVFKASFVGGPSDKESTYPEEVRALAQKLGVIEQCEFVGPVPNTETFRYYRSHDIYVNCAGSGMLDKTIFKAAAAGCLVLCSSLDIARAVDPRCVFQEGNREELVKSLEFLLATSPTERQALRKDFDTLVKQNTLSILMDKLVEEMRS